MVLTELQVEAGGSPGRPQTQGVDVVVGIARHWTIIRHCQYRLEMFKPT